MFKNELGNKYGFWTVIAKAPSRKNKTNLSVPARWLCKCRCGNEKIVDGDILRDGSSKSCGFWSKHENNFLRKMEKCKKNANGCLEWQGMRDKDGYARFGEKAKIVSRILYEKKHGAIPEGMCVCHVCDNPGCVNIDHLWLGTVKQNNNDKKEKGRCVFGSKHHKTHLKESDIDHIKILFNEGVFQSIIAEEYKISQSTVSSIGLNKFWKHVD